MRLFIQIPCYNESESLPETIRALPRRVEGFTSVEFLVIDDGSSDATADVARKLGVEHIVTQCGHQGLARAFISGLVASSERGADVIVNTDADNQYDARDIQTLVLPILQGRADIVVGARPIKSMNHFTLAKRALQVTGSFFVRAVFGVNVSDVPSGFRALSRDSALRLQVFTDFTYTIETLIQARQCNLRVVSVPIRVNNTMSPSRLFRSNVGYVVRGVVSMLQGYLIYRPAHLFGFAACLFLLVGVLLGVRYLLFMMEGEGRGHVQSVIACAVMVLCGVFMSALGMLAHLQGINRRLLEETRYLLRSQRIRSSPPAAPDLGKSHHWPEATNDSLVNGVERATSERLGG